MEINRLLKYITALSILTFTFINSSFSTIWTSVQDGDWTDPCTWDVGCGLGNPNTALDTVFINHNVIMNANRRVRNLDLSATASLNLKTLKLTIHRDFTCLGTITGNNCKIDFVQEGTLFGAGSNLQDNGQWNFRANYTIDAGCEIVHTKAKFQVHSGNTVTNNGSVSLSGSSDYLRIVSAAGTWINAANSSLTIYNSIIGAGTLDASGVDNFVNYRRAGTTTQDIYPGTYYNLRLMSTATKRLTNSNVTTHHFRIDNGVPFDMQTFEMNLTGDWFNSGGNITMGVGSNVNFSGTSNQFINGSTTFRNIEIDNPGNTVATVSPGIFQITGTLQVTDGTFDPNNIVILVSDATATARIGAVGVGGTINDGMIMQRFVSARPAGWADLACPAAAGTETLLDWDQTPFGSNEIFMSAVNGINGIACCPTFHSVWQYNESATAWDSLFDTSNPLTPGVGYELWLGHDLDDWNGGTFDTRARPHTGDLVATVTRTPSVGDGFNLIGNPYASWLDWDAIFADASTTNLDNAFYIWDANTANYAVFGAGDEIPPHQGFWVHSSAGVPTLTFKESHKSTTTASTYFKKALENESIAIKISSLINDYSHTSFVKFNANAEVERDATDAVFRVSRYEEAPNINSVVNNEKLTVNSLPFYSEKLVVDLIPEVGISGEYKLTFAGVNSVAAYDCIILEDTKTNQFIDLRETSTYSFHILESEKNSRFKLHLGKSSEDCKEEPLVATENNYSPEGVNIIQVNNNQVAVEYNFNELKATTITIYDMVGKPIANPVVVNAMNGRKDINIPSSAQGIYLVVVETKTSKFTKKINIQ